MGKTPKGRGCPTKTWGSWGGEGEKQERGRGGDKGGVAICTCVGGLKMEGPL